EDKVGAPEKSVFHVSATQRRLAPILIICLLVLGGISAYVFLRRSGTPLATNNADAHALYLKGRERIETMDPGEIEKGGEYFREAIRLAPNYALAHVGMADYYISAKR